MRKTDVADRRLHKLCAKAMGFNIDHGWHDVVVLMDEQKSTYHPLTNKEQLYDLIERFDLRIHRDYVAICHQDWTMPEGIVEYSTEGFTKRSEIARAIVSCVAKMQHAKEQAVKYV